MPTSLPDHSPAAHAARPARAGAAIVLLLVAAVAAAWLRSHPDRSFEAGYGIAREVEVGRTVWTSLEHGHGGSPGVLEIEHLAPRATTDGAAVEVEYLVCELDGRVLAADGVVGFGYGLPGADVGKYCRRTWPAVGSTIALGTEPRQDLIVGVTPTRPGRTVVDHHVIRFAEGWQHGEDDIHATVDLTAAAR